MMMIIMMILIDNYDDDYNDINDNNNYTIKYMVSNYSAPFCKILNDVWKL